MIEVKETMEQEKATDNNMGTAQVGKLMVSIGIPIVFSMMLQAASLFVQIIQEYQEV